jgi:5-methylcytosine-specific restriction endonuclease McrA
MNAAKPKHYAVVQSKPCSKCGVEKPASEFIADPRHADGLRSDCKECFYSRERYYKALDYRHANRDQVKLWNRKQRSARLRYQERWRQGNPKAASDKDRRSRQRQRAKDPIAYRAQVQASTNRRRAKKRNNGPHDFTRHEWEAIKVAYEHRCAYCGIAPEQLSIDHALPLARGGVHSAWNIVPACLQCNIRKGARLVAIPDYSRHPYV